jgi:hypothetical protein
MLQLLFYRGVLVGLQVINLHYIIIFCSFIEQFDFVEIEWGGVDWIGLAQDKKNFRALVNTAMNLRAP